MHRKIVIGAGLIAVALAPIVLLLRPASPIADDALGLLRALEVAAILTAALGWVICMAMTEAAAQQKTDIDDAIREAYERGQIIGAARAGASVTRLPGS